MTTPITVSLPNGDCLRSTTDACSLALPQLPAEARDAHILPGLTHSSLVSIGKLCDAGCTATFDANQVVVCHADKFLLRGTRDRRTGLWRIPLQNMEPPTAPKLPAPPPTLQWQSNSAYHASNLPALIKFLHAAAFSPVKSTWLKAAQRGFFHSWPGITPLAISKHFPASEATTKGHLDQTRKNVRTTRLRDCPAPIKIEPGSLPTTPTAEHNLEQNEEAFDDPLQEIDNEPTHQVFATIADTGKIYTDQTGRFPVTSSNGHQYVLVLYDYDTNGILTEPLKNRTGGEILRAYQKLHAYLTNRGFRPRTHWLDNEASAALKQFNHQQQVEYQLVPPHMHRRNAAERAIRTWKNHFLAGLCSTDDKFPIHLWDRLLVQATLTLNLLRPSRRNPRVSAYQMLEGVFDFNKTPLAPPGTKVILHEKPQQRKSWDPHGTEGWYLGPALDHYRCYRVFTIKTKAERITDTVEFFPQRTPVPYTTPTDVAIRATNDLIRVLENPTPSTPFAHVGHNQMEAIQLIADIFQKHLPTTPPSPPRVARLPTNPQPPRRAATTPYPLVTPPLPRVAPPLPRLTPSTPTAAPTPTPAAPRHRYPTRNVIPYHHDELNTLELSATLPTVDPNPHYWANAIIDPDTGASMEYRHLIKSPKHQAAWTRSFANEIGRLAQGIGNREKGTNTMFFIHKHQIPHDRRQDVTYGRIVVELRPQKTESNRTRLTVGGNLIDYPGDVSTPTADTTTAKLVINSTISTPRARFMCADIKNFYLGTPMARYEYMRLPIHLIPDEIVQAYDLLPKIHDGHVYLEIQRGMYGLPQAGILANQLLTQRLAPHGYTQCRHTPGLWRHHWRPIMFALVVDDFGVKYEGKHHANHLIHALEAHYEVSKDWTGQLYCGVQIAWDYTNRTVDLSMPGYIQAALHKYQHPTPKRAQHAPHIWHKPNYGAPQQLTSPEDTTALLPPAEVKCVQQITGTLLYYARAVDSTLLVALGTIAAQQARGTLKTTIAVNQLLDYCHTHPSATIRYRASDMILKIHSDASYLSEPKARSRAGGHFFLGDKPSTQPELGNGAILNKSTIMRNVMSSAAEAECGALYDNTKEGVPLRNTLVEMGHPQPPTPIQVDNSTTNGFANKQIKQQKSKSMDMRFYWIQDRVAQKQFHVYWRPGPTNLADYFTKHHPPAHHRRERSTYLHCLNQLSSLLQGCVNPVTGLHPHPGLGLRTQCRFMRQPPIFTNANAH